ncbi:MAG TPA: 3-hydroxyacyl-CoA dehydrogenase/enoyl-CoA hydratase family protein [Acidobacteriota bacterium]|nr:3-hydroxyacyl-CoA dehydrogenase/enoyl-CoA hydratase family protein [Acidobacteriota bacterium]
MERQKLDERQEQRRVDSHRPFRRAAVLGAGVMGSQIAAHLANAGLQVLLLDIAPEGGPNNAVVESAFKKTRKMKPAPFVTDDVARRVELGNFEDDFERIGEADWVLEAVIEKMDVKRQVMEQVERHAAADAVITTNTSGLPIHQISQERSDDFKRRFLGTHFFNPPRYLRLFEVIPTPNTDPDIVERIRWFARIHLGKGVVIAKDRPNFIGNRIGVYAMNRSIRGVTDQGYTIEEIDTLTGPLSGRPKSATFRTADVVGLDTMVYVSENLYEAVPEDESREAFKIPPQVKKLVESGALGAKTRKGFYKKEEGEILSVDFESLEYSAPQAMDLGDLGKLKKIPDLKERLRVLYEDEGRAGAFFRDSILDVMAYAARRIPEISDNPADVDRAVRWGFAWELGPFQYWDALGFQRVLKDMREVGLQLPPWIKEMEDAGAESFYKGRGRDRSVYIPGEGYQPDTPPADEIQLGFIKSDPGREVWKNEEAALLDLGDGVLLYEFRSKANSLGTQVMQGLQQAVEIVEKGDYHGLVIGNEGSNFSVGANLGEAAMAAQDGRFDLIVQAVNGFQATIQRLRYASKPVVTAFHQRVLGGACEIGMGSDQVVAPTESYIGLVELGVGLIPAGTGTTHMAARASETAANELPSQVQPFLQRAFQAIGTAKVATSAQEAVRTGYLLPCSKVIMNSARRIYVAKQEVLRLSLEGYAPPPVRTAIYVLGRQGKAFLEVAARSMQQAGYASKYDVYLADRLAHILCGGDLSGPGHVHEDYLLELEREAFLSLLGEKRTQQRIEHLLKTGKPLRN